MSVPNNQIPNEPDLKDLLDLFRKDLLLNFNCHHIAKIQMFNPINQTAVASVNYKKSFSVLDPITGVYNTELVAYPFLADCPVICLGGGQTSLTFPIQTGDDCLVFFNDRDIGNWFAGSSSSEVPTPRLHSFSDGIILVGLRSLNKVITAYDSARAVLRYGTTTRTAVSATKASLEFQPAGTEISAGVLAAIKNTTAGSLGTLLQNLILQLETLSTAVAALTVTGVTPGSGVSGIPVNAPVFVGVTTQLALIATQLGTLLE